MRFIADSMLGGLAKYLRMIGFSTKYFNKIDDKEILRILEEDKDIILLTKDKGIKINNPKYNDRILLIRSDDKVDQTVEVIKTFNLKDKIEPFVRCMECDTLLEPIDKNYVKNLVEEETFKSFDEFYRCPKCNKIYWFSTHTQRMEIIIQRILKKSEENI